jgi:tRNA U34 5-methylaminomethyl-2-thiouridine-forming methyltransferase MnmC
LQREIIITADGSKTIHIIEWNEQYHSIHGAIQEANHVYIKHGLLFFVENNQNSSVISSEVENQFQSPKSNLSILEIGFGTGLNAFLTILKSEEMEIAINYVGVDAYPVSAEESAAMNYPEQLDINKSDKYDRIHQVPWEKKHAITSNFELTKQKKFFIDIDDKELYDLIYFDAFGARVQPELWTEDIFKKMYDALRPNGILVTYAAKGSVRRAMISVGFNVEQLPGPPGKREMLRARKDH